MNTLRVVWWRRQSGRSCTSYDRDISAPLHIIACIEEPAVEKRILDHLKNRNESPQPASYPVRAPPPHLELDRP